jgi:2-desacetyl-2-hydroxyethyl bacteriochlorophyllide A dehydrogenase
MKAALLTEPYHFEIVDRPMPAPQPGEILVRVARVGICGSDVHIYRGEYIREQLPRVPGHEFSGEVVDVADKSTGFKPGDLVTADINIGCGHCLHCLADDAMLCQEVKQIGIHRDGAFSQYITFPAKYAIKLAPGMTPAMGALVEPAGCVARNLRRCHLAAGQSLFVVGAGPMGMLHVQIARTSGAAPIVVLEANPKLAALAKAQGADYTATNLEEAREINAKITQGRGFDIVAECVGKPELYEFGISMVRAGGVLSCFGLAQAGQIAKIPPYNMVMQEKSMVGSVGATARDMITAMTLIAGGRIAAGPYTECVYELENIEEAFRAFTIDKVALKVQLAP